MGHYSAGFTRDTHRHLMEALPKRQVEWIDEQMFPEGWDAASKIRLRTTSCSLVHLWGWWAREDLNLGPLRRLQKLRMKTT